jgi:hypothetical protein
MSSSSPPPPKPKKDPGRFGEVDTDLNKFSHGNFDVEYLPDQAIVLTTFRAKYEFEQGIPVTFQQEMKKGMLRAIENWSNSGVYLWTSNSEALNEVIEFRFRLVESTTYNKIIDVYKDSMRPYVFRDLNISIDWRFDIKTLTHELGHVFGNYDEYGGEGILGWIERRMWWHDNDHLDDHEALMNSGLEFRTRYFDHYQAWVNEHFARLGISYALGQGQLNTVRSNRSSRAKAQWVNTGVVYAHRPCEGSPRERPGPLRSRDTEMTRRYELEQ